jgi:hypothetical protein
MHAARESRPLPTDCESLSPLPRLCWICITDDRVRSAGIRSSRDCFLSRMGFDVTAGAPRLRFNRMV